MLPSDQPVKVRLEKRAKGKTATVISGLDPVASDLPGLLKTLKAKCGSGGTVRDDAIEIQGDHRDAVTKALAAAGYPVQP